MELRTLNAVEPVLQPLQAARTDSAARRSPVKPTLQRIPLLWWLRNQARRMFFAWLRHIASIRESRDILSDFLRSQNATPLPPELSVHRQPAAPYPELRRERHDGRICKRSDVIFITGRFRSGSTLIWNVFRNLPACTAYYEPFNERRWFDPRTRGSHVDASHVNVSDYWTEYNGLEAALSKDFSADWKFQHLYMPAHAWMPAMQRYVETLIERAAGRPVLQFNEVDFRLPWLRARFPHAKVLHVFRHPRDQWCSTLGRNLKGSTSHTLREFEEVDGFYLLPWGRDLHRCFPFLTLDEGSHPYELFYQIWKLSYLFGHLYCDVSISFESVVSSPAQTLRKVFGSLSITDYELSALLPLVSPVSLGKWRSYAADEWFEAIEERVDQTLEDYVTCLNLTDAARVSPVKRNMTS